MNTVSRSLRWALAALVLLTGSSAAPRPTAAQSYSVQDIGSLGRGADALAINAQAWVVGGSYISFGGCDFCHTQAVLFASGVLQNLGTLFGSLDSYALGINDVSQIVGWSGASGGEHAFLWQNGVMQDLGTLPGHSQSVATGVSNSGKVVGSAPGPSRAFLWSPTTGMQDLGTLGGAQSQANAINDFEQVVGWAQTPTATHAFLWSASAGMRDLGTLPGGSYSFAWGINAQGHVVGQSDTASGVTHAFLWTSSGGMQDLGTLPGATESQAFGINDRDQVVGLSGVGGFGHAFLWQNGVMQDLNNRIPAGSGYLLVSARDIDDHGGIAASASGAGVLLVPTALRALAVSPSTVSGGQSATGQITVSDPVHFGVVIFLKSNNPAVTVPDKIVMAEDRTSATFTIATSSVTSLTSADITAKLGTVSRTATLTVTPASTSDTTPPVTSATASPPPNANGWNNTGVTVNLSATDNAGGSGVKEIRYSLSGAQTGSAVVPGSAASISVTLEGTTGVSYYARDNAGNAETARILTLRIDKTSPTVTYTGNAGTYTVDQTVNITCAAADGLSGIATDTCRDITGPAYAFALGVNTFSATATDKAGNTGSGSTSFTVQTTYDSLGTLTTQSVTDPSVARGLLDKLAAAKDAAARGNTTAKANAISAYINQVSAQRGKSLTSAQADLLIRLASAL